jgi:hypothetical protein
MAVSGQACIRADTHEVAIVFRTQIMIYVLSMVAGR